MAVDLSVYQNQKTLASYMDQRRAQNMQNALGNQQLQSQSLAQQQQKNIFATQLLSGAVDQPSYDKARSMLESQGIDTGNFAPDFATGQKQAYQARLAQSPLGSLLNAGMKAEGNLNSGASTFGSAAAAQQNDPMSAAIARSFGNIISGPQSSQSPQGTPQAQVTPQDPQAEFQTALAQAQAQNGVSQAQRPDLANLGASKAPPFSFRGQSPGEAAAAYENARNLAFEAYKENPDVIRGKKEAENLGGKVGDEAGDVSKALNTMMVNLPAVVQRIKTIKTDAPNSSEGYGVDPSGDGGWATDYAKSRMGQFFEPGRADANASIRQAAAQGVFPEINAALGQTGTKGNKFLENIINNAVGLPADVPSGTKQSLADKNLQMYISNVKAAAAHAREIGQTAPSDAEIDDAVKQAFAAKPTPLPAPQGATDWKDYFK